jgi:ABC-type glycerol-3-phosphate transport system substrate-binding protein
MRSDETSETSEAARLTRAAILRRAGALGVAGLSVPSLLAACGGSSSSSSASSSAAAPTASSATSTAAAATTSSVAESSTAAAGVSGKISLLNWNVTTPDVGLGKGLTSAKAAWEAANPGATLTLEGVPFADFVASATTKARAKKLPDVITLLPGLNHAAVFPACTPVKTSDFPDLATNLTGWSGGIIDAKDPNTFAGVPIGGQGVIWYYNKKLFTDAGLDPEKPPTTWDEFAAACKALKAKGITPIGMSGADSFLPWWAWSSFSAQMYPTSAQVLDFQTGKTPLNDAGMQQSLDAVKETYDQGWWNADYKDQKFSDTEAAFIKGKVAMVSGIITDIMNWVVWDEKMGKEAYGVFSAPLLPGATKQAQFYNTTLVYATSKDTKELDTARSFIEYLASAPGQTMLLKQAGQFPNRSDVDVAGATGSTGAAAIQKVIADVGPVDVPQDQFKAAPYAAALQKLTQAITGGDTKGYLADLQKLQENG